ncbi:C40 family peptidase [Streptomyces sp. NPDC050560]|uniref:C40 family peptidase n=1 Tax=Streptomyces sp. NPDC050560 TaxID=3365630 RepID=UPI0037919F44
MRRTLRVRGPRAAAMATLACALTVTAQHPAHAEPRTLPEVRAELKDLYHDAEVATDKYNAADEKVKKETKHLKSLKSQVEAADKKLAKLTSAAGAAARAQYRNGGVPVVVQIAAASDPAHVLDNTSLAHQAQQSTLSVVKALTKTREQRSADADDATEELGRLKDDRRAKDKHRKTVKDHISSAQLLEASLAEKQRRELDALDDQESKDNQKKWEDSGVLDHVGTDATAAGKKAIAYATAQLGKPYVWGAVGPGSFDCSGLTSQAWLAAGESIPRTSQEQWRQLTHVPVDKMRPGDLIIYFSDASHVALYVGDGQIIEAPRPGRWVTVAPAGSMEILGAVRPDA